MGGMRGELNNHSSAFLRRPPPSRQDHSSQRLVFFTGRGGSGNYGRGGGYGGNDFDRDGYFGGRGMWSSTTCLYSYLV